MTRTMQVFLTLCAIFCLDWITPAASWATDCAADVTFVDASPTEDGGHWLIQFQVEVADCSVTSGKFDFEFTFEDPENDSVQTLTRSEAWTENNTSSFALEFSIPSSGGEFVGDVTVLEDTVMCTCRE
ncbi:MAG: hypothetical protein MPN21_24260 [Thermoanaerobaculia bacterium]|nr:hypothetical protein [Thermoanaerobaculia bacterium]